MERPLKSPVRDIINKYDISHRNYSKLDIYITLSAISIIYVVLVIFFYCY